MNMMPLKKDPAMRGRPVPRPYDGDGCLYCEEYFNETLSLERKRTERSRRPLQLMLMDVEKIHDRDERQDAIKRISRVLSSVTRDTDVKGWYKKGAVMGVIFTETNGGDHAVLGSKLGSSLYAALSGPQKANVIVTYHGFHGEKGAGKQAPVPDLTLYPDLPKKEQSHRAAFLMKRWMDLVGAVAGIILFSPLFLVIPALIKLTSKGPVLFRQERIGQHGKKFTFLKFRTMYVNNDPGIHREYIHNLIAGKIEGSADEAGGDKKVYKITNDTRITPIGGILRKTSMDELPQFLNVIRGEMSLIGPRPPIPYEVEQYDIWHWRRIMDIKPGITGLWQVKGRSSTTFDDMVRLDLQYAKEWSLWLDVKILLMTPWAVIRGKGAY
jgi:lipopolysaccharide/colanic/teichoic acid biosynthesis glycosyltransferase